jgi:hypothetical protein
LIEPDRPRPVRRGLRLFADQIRRSEFARAVMTHALGDGIPSAPDFMASAFQARCCRANANSDYGRDLCSRESYTGESYGYESHK